MLNEVSLDIPVTVLVTAVPPIDVCFQRPGRLQRGNVIRLSRRWKVVVDQPFPGVVLLGFFLDGELLYVIDEPAGEA